MTRKKGFTLIELLVVIAIIALLVSILMPSLAKAKDLARDVMCKTNLNSISKSCVLYSNDYYEYFPTRGQWMDSWQPNVMSLYGYKTKPNSTLTTNLGDIFVMPYIGKVDMMFCPGKALETKNSSLSGYNPFDPNKAWTYMGYSYFNFPSDDNAAKSATADARFVAPYNVHDRRPNIWRIQCEPSWVQWGCYSFMTSASMFCHDGSLPRLDETQLHANMISVNGGSTNGHLYKELEMFYWTSGGTQFVWLKPNIIP